MRQSLSFIKYLLPFSLYALAYYSFMRQGIYCWLPVLYAFIVIPSLELILPVNNSNMDKAREHLAQHNPVYDIILYLIVIFQYYALWIFIKGITKSDLSVSDITGRVLSMGLLCGTFGINVGHELGHRKRSAERMLARLLLLSGLYMHFYIEHNKGHHKNVATPDDPSSARRGQSIYSFWPQTIVGTHKKAWQIAIKEARKERRLWPLIFNEMFLYQFIQLAFLFWMLVIFGKIATGFFILAAIIGILLLEAVNYIEHYGLSRMWKEEGYYEKVKPHHSWNSDHVIGRLMLFELTRHSDHHYQATRKYQLLRHVDGSPQMPTGYPGMILLSLLPPLWFRVVHAKMKTYEVVNEFTPAP